MVRRLKQYEFKFECLHYESAPEFRRYIQCTDLIDALDYVFRDPSGYNDLEGASSVLIRQDPPPCGY